MNVKATHLLVRHHEIALKGKNRPNFERKLIQNIARISGENVAVEVLSGRFVVPLDGATESPDDLLQKITRLGGVVAVSPCVVLVKPNIDDIQNTAVEWAKEDLKQTTEISRFAVRTRRINKTFPLSSSEIESKIGSHIQTLKKTLVVDLKHYDWRLSIEVRHQHTLIYSKETPGVHGLPMDPTQRVVCLLSGGIDSPVAAYEVMIRGCSVILAHFHSQPFTSAASINKVRRIAEILRKYSPYPIELWLIPLLEIQKATRDQCNERYRTIHYRRYMMRIAEELARLRHAKAMVTGDALGQVASQTLTNLQVIDDAVTLPMLRPLITNDKSLIIEKAQKIGTYEISIEHHDDSCVLFASERPSTQASLTALKAEEEMLDSYRLIFEALDSAEKIVL